VSLKSRTMAAGRWITAAVVARVILQFLQTIVLARILAPSDFGVMALVSGLVALGVAFSDLGLSNAMMHFETPDHNTWSTLYWINLVAGLGLMLFFMILASPIANFYDSPVIAPMILSMSLVFPLTSLIVPYRILAEKELRFALLSAIEIAAVIVGVVVALLCALSGMGVFALVAGLLLSTIARLGLTFVFMVKGSWPSFRFDLTGIQKFLRYGLYRIGETFTNSISGQADIFIGGYFVGASGLGAYSLPKDLCLQVANTAVNPIVARVGLPVMAALRHDKPLVKEVYLKMSRMTSSINFPIYFFLAAFAEDIVKVLWGNQWREAIYFLQIFAFWGAIRSTGNLVGSLLYATGSVRRAFLWNLGMLIIVVLTVTIGAFKGEIAGLVWAMLTIQVVIFIPVWKFLVFPACGASLRDYLGQHFPPAVTTLMAGGTTCFLVGLLHTDLVWLRLCFAFTVGALLYFGLSALINRTWLITMKELIFPQPSYKRSAKL
jgi:O-antigen/teichoic acid export membrane protein